MCEFLVYAKIHWMEGVDRRDWDASQLEKYDRRLIKGNLIVVRPDGWKWGKAEKPPDFVVIKVPDMTVKEGEAYLVKAFDTSALPGNDGEYPVKYRNKYKFATADIDAALISEEPIAIDKTTFETKLEDRDP